jgi:hypothetical protein
VVAAALAAVGCSDNGQPLPQEVQFQVTPLEAALCDLNTVKRDARAYFARDDDRPVQELIRSMQHAETAADSTDIGFDIIAYIVQVTEDGTQDGTPQMGSDLINGLLACMTFAAGTEPELPIDFTPAFSDTGAIGVRGSPADDLDVNGDGLNNDPVVSHQCDLDDLANDEFCPVGTWGVEPANDLDADPPVTPEWAAVLGVGKRVLFYGARVTEGVPGGGEARLFDVFDWEKVPDIQFADADIRVARCTPETGPERVQEIEPPFFRVLAVSEPTFCADLSSAPSLESGLLGILKNWTRTASGGLLFPQLLHASASPGRCCGGAPPDFTPFVIVDAGNVNLTFETQPQDAVIGPDGTASVHGPEDLPDNPGTYLPVIVSAKGNNGTPLPEVVITLTIEVNQSSKADLTGNTVVTTDLDCTAASGCTPDGLARFTPLFLNKPGGYTLVATAVLPGYPNIAAITSEAFHITQ